MKRDMEYVRQLLINISDGNYKHNLNLGHDSKTKVDDENYYYHLNIMQQAGLITFKENKYMGGTLLINVQMTWLGNDFYDSMKEETLWNKAKENAKQRGVELTNVPFDVVGAFLKSKAIELLGLEL